MRRTSAPTRLAPSPGPLESPMAPWEQVALQSTTPQWLVLLTPSGEPRAWPPCSGLAASLPACHACSGAPHSLPPGVALSCCVAGRR